MNRHLIPANIAGYRILLASNSPRRKELMQLLELDFTVVKGKEVEEVCPPGMAAERMPEYLSIIKAAAYHDTLGEKDLLITADTMVILDGRPMGKPATEQEARSMLRSLSGRTHQVITGVTVDSRKLTVSFSVTTYVAFAPLTDRQINLYVEKFKPLDKAGAYGIQEWIGAIGIEGINGSFYNVMGLPVHYLNKVLEHFDPAEIMALDDTDLHLEPQALPL